MVPMTSAQLGQLLETASPGSTIYLVGIGGCGVSGLAHLLLDLGFRVVGSDLAANEETRQLAERGASIHLGHNAEQLAAAHPILVAYSSAIRLDNPELQAAERLQIPLARRALLLAALVHRQRGICVAGMHGKTTTSALLAFALENLGAKPSYAIGALVPQLVRHARFSHGAQRNEVAGEGSPSPRPSPPGRGGATTLLDGGVSSPAFQSLSGAAENASSSIDPNRAPSPGGEGRGEGGCSGPISLPFFIAEADESDGTLSEFRPQHAIVLNVDAEHLDFYANFEAICREFTNFAEQTHETLVFCADDARLAELFARRPGAVSYGFHPLANYRLVRREARVERQEAIGEGRGSAPTSSPNASCLTPLASFEVWHSGQKLGDFSINLLGEKNISNAGAVIALLHRLGHAASDIARAIADFTGAARRQQELFSDARFRVFDDYGHHPAEIVATLKAFKSLGARRLLVAFQPHRFTRTQALMSEFATSFSQADKLWVADIYAASEPEIPGVTSAKLVEAIRATQTAEHVPSLDGLRRAVRAAMLPGDVVLFLGAGDITKAAHDGFGREACGQFRQQLFVR